MCFYIRLSQHGLKSVCFFIELSQQGLVTMCFSLGVEKTAARKYVFLLS